MYEFLRDQGSFIAGILTLVGGGLAYFAGRIQATATRKGAAAQVEAIREQIDQRNQEIAELRQIEVAEKFAALARECARIHRDARDRLTIAQENFSKTPDGTIPRDVTSYRIAAHNVLKMLGPSDFRGAGIRRSASTLNAMVDVLSSALESAGKARKLTGGALIGHLNNVISAANDLKEKLEKWEIGNPQQD